MDVREKLVELVHNARMNALWHNAPNPSEYITDMLMEDGVTVQEWISVKERLPECETEVLVLAERKIYSIKNRSWRKVYFVLTGMYEDGKKHTEDSDWRWETKGFEYDEETDDYIIPEGWWEYKHYIDDEVHNYCIDDTVTHWMPLPDPPKGE